MNKLRATLALAMALCGVTAASPPPPSDEAPKPPVRDDHPGLKHPTRGYGRGGGLQNTCEDGPSCPGGPIYRKAYDPDTKSTGWRAYSLALYYKAKDGQIHAYQPGQDVVKDKAFPALAKKLGLTLMNRAARRALHREERARYKAIQKARKEDPEPSFIDGSV